MPITLLDAVEFSKIPSLQFVVPVVSADPTGYEAGLIYNNTSKLVKFHNGTAWVPWTSSAVTITAGAGLTGGGDLSANRSLDVGQGTGITVAADAVALDTAYTDSRYINTAGDTMTGALVLATNSPGAPLEAASKGYVDAVAQGFDFKDACRAVATTNITLSGTQTVDGVALVANDRCLVSAQSTATQNGIYLVAAGAWTRTLDADASGEIVDGTLVPIAEGTANADSLYICTSVGTAPWVPGTNTSAWTKFLTLTDLQAGAGLTKSGSTINVVGDSNLNVAADIVNVLSAPKWTTARSISLTGDVTGTAATVDGSANVSIATTVVSAGKRYAADVAAGTAVVITHNLNTRDVHVGVYRTTTPWDAIQCGIEMTSVNTVTLKFASSVAASAYRCVVLG